MADARDIPFGCACGSLTGHVKGTHPRDGMHIACVCRNCAAAEADFTGSPPGPSGADIYWIAPDRIVFDTGLEHLGQKTIGKQHASVLVRHLSQHAADEHTNHEIDFVVGRHIATLAAIPNLDPIKTRTFVPNPSGGRAHENGGVIMRFVFGQILADLVGGRRAKHSLFDTKTLAPIRTSTVLSKEDRKAADLA